MRVLSVQVGKGRWIEKSGQHQFSAIEKPVVKGLVATCGDRLEGDEQSDKAHHGGFYKAVYGFAFEEYRYWEHRLGRTLAFGSFGENLTVQGLSETVIEVGDRFQLGSAELVARCPRIPCRTLAFWLERQEVIEMFLKRAKPGIYFSIERQGEFQAGDELKLLSNSESGLSISEIFALETGRSKDKARLLAASQEESLPPATRERFIRLAQPGYAAAE